MHGERMSVLDSFFLRLEDESTTLQVASVCIFEGPAPSYEELVGLIAGKLPLLPRYRQRVRFVPYNLGHPVWVDDPHFRLSYHVRRMALPAPGGAAELQQLVGWVMSQRLDRSRPLWETCLVEGLPDSRWALLAKAHHCMVDGISGMELVGVLLDRTPQPPPQPPQQWAPAPEPGTAQLLLEALGGRLANPRGQLATLAAGVRAPGRVAGRVAGTVRGLPGLAGVIRPTVQSSLIGPLGPHRSYRMTSISLPDARTVRAAFGGTINDVVLASITAGFRALLLSRHELAAAHSVRALVPVSVRTAGQEGTYDNRVSAMFADLPVAVDEPVARLQAVQDQLRHLKESGQAVAGQTLTELAGYAPPLLVALGLRTAFRMPQHSITTVATNVPGPRVPLYAAGRRMQAAFPYVPIAYRLRTGIAAMSYLDTLHFGITADDGSVPDIDVIRDGIAAGLAELVAAAKNQPGTPPTPRTAQRPAGTADTNLAD